MPTFMPAARSTFSPWLRELTDNDLLNGFFLTDDKGDLFTWEGGVIEVTT